MGGTVPTHLTVHRTPAMYRVYEFVPEPGRFRDRAGYWMTAHSFGDAVRLARRHADSSGSPCYVTRLDDLRAGGHLIRPRA